MQKNLKCKKMSDVQKRTDDLELIVSFLEEHLAKYAHESELRAVDHIQERINTIKRELQIRRDYST